MKFEKKLGTTLAKNQGRTDQKGDPKGPGPLALLGEKSRYILRQKEEKKNYIYIYLASLLNQCKFSTQNITKFI